jgi:hypothetical protein
LAGARAFLAELRPLDESDFLIVSTYVQSLVDGWLIAQIPLPSPAQLVHIARGLRELGRMPDKNVRL